MFEIKNVTKLYEIGNTQVHSLDSVSLKIENGEFLSVIGPSGSGKSTLLYTIGGLLTPTKGEVNIQGTEIYQLKSRERARFRRENIGFIFPNFRIAAVFNCIGKCYASTSFGRHIVI